MVLIWQRKLNDWIVPKTTISLWWLLINTMDSLSGVWHLKFKTIQSMHFIVSSRVFGRDGYLARRASIIRRRDCRISSFVRFRRIFAGEVTISLRTIFAGRPDMSSAAFLFTLLAITYLAEFGTSGCSYSLLEAVKWCLQLNSSTNSLCRLSKCTSIAGLLDIHDLCGIDAGRPPVTQIILKCDFSL